MKALVLFDTNFGHTKQIAEAIAKELGKDAKLISGADFKAKDLEGVELLVVGSPIVGWKPTEKMMAFLAAQTSLAGKRPAGTSLSVPAAPLQGIKAATFDTRVKLFIHGDASQTSLAGKRPAGTSLSAPIGGGPARGGGHDYSRIYPFLRQGEGRAVVRRRSGAGAGVWKVDSPGSGKKEFPRQI